MKTKDYPYDYTLFASAAILYYVADHIIYLCPMKPNFVTYPFPFSGIVTIEEVVKSYFVVANYVSPLII